MLCIKLLKIRELREISFHIIIAVVYTHPFMSNFRNDSSFPNHGENGTCTECAFRFSPTNVQMSHKITALLTRAVPIRKD